MLVKETPIIFSTQMVQALLDGRKTQTRRLVKGEDLDLIGRSPKATENSINLCRFGKVGDRLWVREKIYCFDDHKLPKECPTDFDGNLNNYGCTYASIAREDICPSSVISPIYMPRWCCGIELVLTEMSIERVGDISDCDAISEGLKIERGKGLDRYSYGSREYFDPQYAFRMLWNSINSKDGTTFTDNPWVWVLKFEVEIK